MTTENIGNLSARIASLSFLRGDVTELKHRMALIDELKQHVDDLERRISTLLDPAVEEKVDGETHKATSLPDLSAASGRSLLHDIQSHFVCESCGSTHLIAALVKCTECNHQAWFGWSPAPEQKRKREKPTTTQEVRNARS